MTITLTGNNNFMLGQELERLKNEFVSKYGDLAYEKVDGEEATVERLVEAATSLPFLVAGKLVILRNPGTQKQFMETIESTLKAVPETTQLVIYEPKIDKRSSYFKVLKAKTDFKELNELDVQKLSNWIVQYVQGRAGKITPNDANYLVAKLGQSQQLLASELEKLLIYNNEISKSNIDLLTEATPQSTIFELLDATFAGNAQKAIKIYQEQRALKVEPQQIIAMIAWQLHILALLKTAGDKTPDEIAGETKLNPYVVRKTLPVAKRISPTQLKRLIADALELDIRLKSEAVDPDDALKEFLLNATS